MDRRKFFKSSTLWLAGLIISPHIEWFSKRQWKPVGGCYSRVFITGSDCRINVGDIYSPNAFLDGAIQKLKDGEWHHLTIEMNGDYVNFVDGEFIK